MSSGFQNPITIKDAIDKIHSRQFLLPAIQRKFTWSSNQIEMLFDSIMRGYPINSFMFWKISDSEIKKDYKFYEFLTAYREFFSENNKDIDTKGVPDFEAVIDGQQRLTSLYIGLRGSYAYKMPRKWWKDTEECLPTRKLYLNLEQPSVQEYDNQKTFDFRFLSKSDLANYAKRKEKYTWFEVGQILDLDSTKKVSRYLDDNSLKDNDYAYDTLSTLYESIHVKPLINYYLQEEQEPDKVLDIFIRTNSGGTPLSFSDLLMSIASANWKTIDARKEIEKLVSEVYDIGRPGFVIDKDFVLKTCLVLFVDNIKFQLKNFTYANVQIFESNWDNVKKSIVAAFTLFEKLGFNDKNFRAKNAAIPVIYYIYYNNLCDSIVKPTYSSAERKTIAQWLILTFIKSVFGGQTDSVLVTMRKVLKECESKAFPAKSLMDAFKNDPARNYSFDDDFIDGLLESQKDSNEAFYILHLMYPNMDYYNQDFHQDHLHPATVFQTPEKLEASIPECDRDFAADSKNWNSIANLQLLNGLMNESKNDIPLKEWANSKGFTNDQLYVKKTTSLDIKDFAAFIADRKEVIKKYLKKVVGGIQDEIIETDRLILRHWTESDAESLYEYAQDPDVGPIAGWLVHTSVENSLGVIRNIFNSEECYAICEKTNGIAIGAIELKLNGHTDMTERDDECELGFWIGKPFWGKGYVPEAAKAIINHGFNDLGMSTVWCGYYDGNDKSKRAQEKIGFVYHHTCEKVQVPLLNETRVGHTNCITKEHWADINGIE